ncbi:MAG: DUF2332 family protein [Anaerolineae bacterium]|nr:DUF2332 family protein [Anaerolineae bacterium]
MSNFDTRLYHRFRAQEQFAAAYSPLYAHFFATGAAWAEQPDHPVTRWLLEIGQARDPFDICLLLAAAIHRDVLAGHAAAHPLTPYYPTVGGPRSPDDPALPDLWQATILARRKAYTPFLQTNTVQTNETGRGLAWLWPLGHTGWSQLNLVDLGASAGLNLVADRRAYRFTDEATGEVLADVGQGQPVQFITHLLNRHDLPPHSFPAADQPMPHILSRTGCDLHPFGLDSPEQELTLMAYIWGDQPHRLQRLREGITAWHEVMGNAAAPIHPIDLPDELPTFLAHLPDNGAPVLIYNTWMSSYLKNKGAGLRTHIHHWAQSQTRPTLWTQWEPLHDGPEPPHFGWCAWLVDLWQDGQHQQWQLGWIHPHGTTLHLEPGLAAWIAAAKLIRTSG